MFVFHDQLFFMWKRKNIDQIESLAQDCSNSSANTLELLQSCAKPSKYTFFD